MPEVKVKFDEVMVACDPWGRPMALVCRLCGCSVINKAQHLTWHDDVNMYPRERQVFYAQPWNVHVEDTETQRRETAAPTQGDTDDPA